MDKKKELIQIFEEQLEYLSKIAGKQANSLNSNQINKEIYEI
jgi:hypothetical protein